MASNQWYITPAEIELISFLKQKIIRKLCEEASKQAKDKTHPDIIAAVISHFNLGPSLHRLVNNLVHQLAHSFQGEFRGFCFMSPHTDPVAGHTFVHTIRVLFLQNSQERWRHVVQNKQAALLSVSSGFVKISEKSMKQHKISSSSLPEMTFSSNHAVQTFFLWNYNSQREATVEIVRYLRIKKKETQDNS